MHKITKIRDLPDKCMFFGYGSLMFAAGTRNRDMKHIYTDEEFFPATAVGLKRGLFAEWVISPKKKHAYYGAAISRDSEIFGALFTIHSKDDLIALLDDEYASPVIVDDVPMYELWDITDCFSGVYAGTMQKLTLICKERKPVPENFIPEYLEFVYDNIPNRWIEDFLLTGGVKP
jgi:hypothetical protein